MTAPRITPGPRRAALGGDDWVILARQTGGATRVVADVQRESDAHLIAAAPALAEALAALLPWVEQAWERAQATRLPGDEPPALNAARDALKVAGFEVGP